MIHFLKKNIEPPSSNTSNNKKQKSSSNCYHDNPSFEASELLNQSKHNHQQSLLNSVHKNHEEIHLTQLKSLDSMTTTPLETINTNTNSTTTTGAYAIASSTTLLYITPPHNSSSSSAAGQTASVGGNNALTAPPPPPPPPPPPIGDMYAQGQSQLSSLASYNTAEKLAAAAAHAVSSAAASVVEIPNFSEELSSMIHNSRMVNKFLLMKSGRK